MTRLRSVRLVAAVVLLALASGGCAAHWAYRQGNDALDREEWDLAVARYTRALEKDPKNIRYKMSLETLVEEGYLRKLPEDPFTRSADWTPVYSEPDPDRPGEPPGVYDVKSASELVSLAGTPYNEW